MNAAVGTSKRSRIQLSRSEEEEESEEDFVDTPFKPVQHGVLEQEVSTAEGGPAATAMTTTISYALMKRPLFPLKSRAFDATQYAVSQFLERILAHIHSTTPIEVLTLNSLMNLLYY